MHTLVNRFVEILFCPLINREEQDSWVHSFSNYCRTQIQVGVSWRHMWCPIAPWRLHHNNHTQQSRELD